MRDPIFNDGWREPSDDMRRMVYYVAWVLGLIGGLALAFYSLRLLIYPRAGTPDPELGDASASPWMAILYLALGVLTAVRSGMRLYPEIRRATKRKMTADAFVAGGILVGIALMVLGFERVPLVTTERAGAAAFLFILGIIVLAGSFLAGVGIVVWPKISKLPKTVSDAYVEGRYAIDQRLMEIDDHPNPVEEDCIPMVRLRTSEGRVLNLRAGAVAYDMAEPGKRGTARIAGNRLRSFQPSRTR